LACFDGSPNRCAQVAYAGSARIVRIIAEHLEQGHAKQVFAPAQDRAQEESLTAKISSLSVGASRYWPIGERWKAALKRGSETMTI
jgi:hypothetical protein